MSEEKEPKPKKIFTVKFDIYDDGQIDPDLLEYVQGEVGRPKGWRLQPKDFVRSIKMQISETPHLIFAELLHLMGATQPDIDKLTGSSIDVKQQTVPPEDDSIDEEDFDFT